MCLCIGFASSLLNRHVIQAARNPVELDERQAQAVNARIEIDLRVGAIFTRILSLNLKEMVKAVQEVKVISYGVCNIIPWYAEFDTQSS
jgi:DNA topoisomerase-3